MMRYSGHQSAKPLGQSPEAYADMMRVQASLKANAPRFYHDGSGPFSIFDRKLSSTRPVVGLINDVETAEYLAKCLNERSI